MTIQEPTTKYLENSFDTRAFGNKATVTTVPHNNKIILRSYETLVCEIDNNIVTLHNIDLYSGTTIRHVKEFLLQNGFRAESKAQILNDYGM